MTVGDTGRAECLKKFLDVIYHERTSPRHFTIITGARNGVCITERVGTKDISYVGPYVDHCITYGLQRSKNLGSTSTIGLSKY